MMRRINERTDNGKFVKIAIGKSRALERRRTSCERLVDLKIMKMEKLLAFHGENRQRIGFAKERRRRRGRVFF